MTIPQAFKSQVAGGATNRFFYGTEIGGEVRIHTHRGALEELQLPNLQFSHMVGSTPFYKPQENQWTPKY